MKTFIGRWKTPSENGCDVYMLIDDMGRNLGDVLWDKAPSPEDLSFYKEPVLPILAYKTLVFLRVTTT